MSGLDNAGGLPARPTSCAAPQPPFFRSRFTPRALYYAKELHSLSTALALFFCNSYVYSNNSGLQAQSVLYTQATPDGDATVLLDPNKLSDDGTVALGSTSFSEDGTMMAYTLSSGGSDWRTVHVLRVDQASGAPSDLPDKLERAKFTSLAWTHDGKGFFYHRYPPPAKSGDLGTEVDSNVDKEMWCVCVVGGGARVGCDQPTLAFASHLRLTHADRVWTQCPCAHHQQTHSLYSPGTTWWGALSRRTCLCTRCPNTPPGTSGAR